MEKKKKNNRQRIHLHTSNALPINTPRCCVAHTTNNLCLIFYYTEHLDKIEIGVLCLFSKNESYTYALQVASLAISISVVKIYVQHLHEITNSRRWIWCIYYLPRRVQIYRIHFFVQKHIIHIAFMINKKKIYIYCIQRIAIFRSTQFRLLGNYR